MKVWSDTITIKIRMRSRCHMLRCVDRSRSGADVVWYDTVGEEWMTARVVSGRQVGRDPQT